MKVNLIGDKEKKNVFLAEIKEPPTSEFVGILDENLFWFKKIVDSPILDLFRIKAISRETKKTMRSKGLVFTCIPATENLNRLVVYKIKEKKLV